MHAAFQIIPRGAQIAQFLGLHHLGGFVRRLNLGLFRGDVAGIQFGDPGLARRDVKRQFIVEIQCLVIQQVQRFDIFQQLVFVAEQVVCDLVDLALNVFETGGELGKRRGTAQQPFPERAFAAHVQLGHGKPANGGDDIAQGIPCGADILVAHILQHGLADLLQFGLRGGSKGHDRIGIAHVQLGHAAGDFRRYGRIGLFQRHDGRGIGGFGQFHGGHVFQFGDDGLGLLAGGLGHDGFLSEGR